MGCTRCNGNNNKRRRKKKIPITWLASCNGILSKLKRKRSSLKCQNWPANDDLNQKKNCLLRATELIHILQASIGAITIVVKRLVNGEKKKKKKMKDAHRTIIIITLQRTPNRRKLGNVLQPAFAAKYKFYKTENGQKSCGNN